MDENIFIDINFRFNIIIDWAVFDSKKKLMTL